MNKYYNKYKSIRTARTAAFERIEDGHLDYEDYPNILEIGSIRPCEHDPDLGYLMDGYSTFYWAEYLRKRKTGALTIVDIDKEAIEKARTVLEDFKDVNITFIYDDGMKYVGNSSYNLIYFDGPDDIHFTYEMYRRVDRTKTGILCDDANFSQYNLGKCYRLRWAYGGYYLITLENTSHEMIFYPKVREGKKVFNVGELKLNYCNSNYNRAWENERSIEVPLGQYFLNKFGNNVLEVGCVMPYYGAESHEIIDLCDTHPKNKQINALDVDYAGRNVLCISTIEHLNHREYNNGSDNDALVLMDKIVNTSQNYVITFPATYHSLLDKYVQEKDLQRTVLKRINWENEWMVNNKIEPLESYPFGHRDGRNPDGVFNNANALCVVTNLPELL